MPYLAYTLSGALAFGFVLTAWLASGSSLSAWYAAAGGVALLVPWVMLTQPRPFDRFMIAGCVIDGAGLALLLTLLDPFMGLADWCLGYLVLLAFGVALIGLTLLLMRILPLALAGLMATALAIAWLSWPIWMAPRMERVEHRISSLVNVHPLLAINGQIDHEGLWTHRTLSYRLMNLGQDYPYALPASIWPSVVAHGMVGIVLMMFGWIRARGRRSEPGPPEPSRAPPRSSDDC